MIPAAFVSKVNNKRMDKDSNMSDFLMNKARAKLAIIGLGYVGLPLALAFGEKFKTVAFDISTSRIQELISGIDKTGETTTEDLLKVKNCRFTDEVGSLENCNTYIITVPTPIDKNNRPDLSFLSSATELVAKFLSVGDVVIFESTVYPGATEEVCVRLIEDASGLKFNNEFFVGYSPERINPGDKTHRLTDIVKVTSGSNDLCASYVDDIYKSIIKAGTFKAKSIKIAEAAKVIENTQRDVNIALINELSILFQKLDIDTKAVLDTAASKWNFLNFKPGLVGGHCIGVDPYYLTHKAQEVNHHPELILAGRRLNDNMAKHISDTLMQEIIKNKSSLADFRILIMGITFKENCPDIRNTKVINIYNYFKNIGINADVFDPCADAGDVEKELKITLKSDLTNSNYNAIIIAVAHDEFKSMNPDEIINFGTEDVIIYDLKYIMPDEARCLRL